MLQKTATLSLSILLSMAFTTHAPAADLQISGRQNPVKCLHKKVGGWKNGNPIYVWDCNAGGSENKKWHVLPISDAPAATTKIGCLAQCTGRHAEGTDAWSFSRTACSIGCDLRFDRTSTRTHGTRWSSQNISSCGELPTLFGYKQGEGTYLTQRCREAQINIRVASGPVVRNNNDSGPGSLRQAILDARDGDSISFDTQFFSGLQGSPNTIVLTSGELVIDKKVSISAFPHQGITIEGRGSRIIHVKAGGTSAMVGLTLTGGHAGKNNGGCILNDGFLRLERSTVNECQAVEGGGIYSRGLLSLFKTEILNNRATTNGGGIYLKPTPGLQFKGWNHSIVRESAVRENTARSPARPATRDSHWDDPEMPNPTAKEYFRTGGGGIYIQDGALDLVDTDVSLNTSLSVGGGILSVGSYVKTINSGVQCNTAGTYGGGIAGVSSEKQHASINISGMIEHNWTYNGKLVRRLQSGAGLFAGPGTSVLGNNLIKQISGNIACKTSGNVRERNEACDVSRLTCDGTWPANSWPRGLLKAGWTNENVESN